MKHGSTNFLRAAILLVGGIVLAFCVFVLPVGIMNDDGTGYKPLLIGMYAPAVPFFYVLFLALKLLKLIDDNMAFSKASVTALTRIKHCGLIISAMYAIGMPYIYMVADSGDSPGVIITGLVFVLGPLVAAMFAAVLEKLLKSGMEMKEENDLTV